MGAPAIALQNGEIWFSTHRTPHRIPIDQLKRRSVGDPTFCREFIAKQASMQAIDTWTIEGLPERYSDVVRNIATELINDAASVFASEYRGGCVAELRELLVLLDVQTNEKSSG